MNLRIRHILVIFLAFLALSGSTDLRRILPSGIRASVGKAEESLEKRATLGIADRPLRGAGESHHTVTSSWESAAMPRLQDDSRTRLLPTDPGKPNAFQFESTTAAADHPATRMIRPPWMVARPPAADPPVELGINGRITQAEVDTLETGVDLVLTAIENQLAAEVFSETLPLVGNNFRQAWDNNVSSFRFLSAARAQIITGLSSFSGQADYDPAAVASAIKSRLTTYAGFPTSITVSATTLNDEAQIAFVITRNYTAADVPSRRTSACRIWPSASMAPLWPAPR